MHHLRLRSYPRRRCYRPIEVAKPADAASLAPSLAPATLAAPTTQDAPQPTHGTRRKTAAYIAGGVGIAGVALGTVTGILVLGKKSTVNSGCSSGACNDAGLSAANSGKNLALVSDVGFGVGIVGLAILLLSGNAESEPAPQSAWQPVLSSTSDGLNAGLFRRW